MNRRTFMQGVSAMLGAFAVSPTRGKNMGDLPDGNPSDPFEKPPVDIAVPNKPGAVFKNCVLEKMEVDWDVHPRFNTGEIAARMERAKTGTLTLTIRFDQ